jgi:TIR domain
MPDFDTITCEGCGKDLAVPKGNPDSVRYHRGCAWYEAPCEICGKPMRLHRDWQHPPKAHKECNEAAKAEGRSPWYHLPCEICGDPIAIHSEWANPPRVHKKSCEYCGGPIRVHIHAVNVPKYHRKCETKALAATSAPTEQPLPRLTVFLCHSSGDKPKIRNLYKRLRDDGFSPWPDEEELLPGQDWSHEITKAVRSSHVVVVCLSAGATAKTGYVQKEIKYALDVADEQPEGTIFLIPLKLEECEVPSRLQRWQWVKLFEDSGYDRLLRALKARREHEKGTAAARTAQEKSKIV